MVIFRLCLALFGVATTLATLAQSVRIAGDAPDYIGKQVIVYAEADPLSERRMVLESTEVDSTGKFLVMVDVAETTPVALTIDHVRGPLILSPRSGYSVFFPPLSREQVRSFSETASVELVFARIREDDINAMISDLNYAVDSFLVANVGLIGSKRFPEKLNTFEAEMQRRFGNTENAFLRDHLTYTMALTEFSTRAYTRLDLFERHLADSIYPEHPTFFTLLRAYYQDYFKQFEANYGTELVRPALADAEPGKALLELMERDYLARPDTLKEMVAIHALMEMYPKLQPREVVAALAYISENGQTDFNKRAAANAIQVLTSTERGFPAPEITLQNQYNETVSLSELQGKHVYLEFMSTWCTDCAREQTILPDLIADYGDVAEVVTVVVDSEREDYKRYIQQHPEYKWNILFDPTGYEVVNQYGVRALPMYFLIGPDGNFVRSPVASPTGGIVEELYPILQKAREAQRLKVGEK